MPPYIDPRAGTGAIGTGKSFFDRDFGNTGNLAIAQNAGVQGPGGGFANTYMDPNAFGNPIPAAPRAPFGPTNVPQPGPAQNPGGGYAPVGANNTAPSWPGAGQPAGGGGGATTGDPLQDLINAYPDRVGTDQFNTGSVTSDWGDLLAAFPQLGEFLDLEAHLRSDTGSGEYFGPFEGAFSNDPFDLPGNAHAINTLLNIALSTAGSQQGRSSESEALMKALASGAQGSAQMQGANAGAANATDLMSPGHLNQLEQAMRGQASEDVARSRMAGEQSMRDAGFFGQGGAGADPLMALSRGAGDQLAGMNRQITGDLEGIRRENLQTGMGALGTSSDIYRGLMDPTRQYAGMLKAPENYAQQQFMDLLGQAGSMEVGTQIRADQRGGIEDYLMPLLGSTIGAAGQSQGFGNLFKGLF